MNTNNENHRGVRVMGRLTVEETSAVLGCKPHDIPILVRANLLKPLGNPPVNSTKYFAATYIRRLAVDEPWLGRATKALNTFWTDHNSKRKTPDKPNSDL